MRKVATTHTIAIMSPAATPDLSPLQARFHNVPPQLHTSQWDDLYQEDMHPWDRAGPSVALADLLIQRSDLVPPAQDHDRRGEPVLSASGEVLKHTALVPGCGIGHDALLLASFGYDVWALDVSERGLELARENERACLEKGLYKADEGTERGRIHWINADFFEEKWSKGLGTDGSGKFDLIFDYTVCSLTPFLSNQTNSHSQFLCALPLDLRPQWAVRISSLLAPKARLICLEFPSYKPLRDPGPPWGVNPEVYEALLAAPGEPVHYDGKGDGTVVSIPSPKPRDDAVHRLCLVKPPRTHKAGMDEDGSVKDFVSVWSR